MPGAERDTEGQAGGAILAYHRVAILDSDFFGLAVRPDTFRDHMLRIRSQQVPMPLNEIAAGAASGDLPARAVAVTIDDGYADWDAVDILCELAIPATFFVTTGWLDSPGEFWWDVLERILLGAHRLPPRLPALEAGALPLPVETAEDRVSALRAVHAWLLGCALPAREEGLQRIASWSGIDLTPRSSHRPLNRSEIRRLASRPGITVGAHGVHHLPLPAQMPEVQAQEIEGCKRALEDVLAGPADGFCYPFGLHDDGVVERVRQASFRLAVTTQPGRVVPGVEVLRLPRVMVSECPADSLAY